MNYLFLPVCVGDRRAPITIEEIENNNDKKNNDNTRNNNKRMYNKNLNNNNNNNNNNDNANNSNNNDNNNNNNRERSCTYGVNQNGVHVSTTTHIIIPKHIPIHIIYRKYEFGWRLLGMLMAFSEIIIIIIAESATEELRAIIIIIIIDIIIIIIVISVIDINIIIN